MQLRKCHMMDRKLTTVKNPTVVSNCSYTVAEKRRSQWTKLMRLQQSFIVFTYLLLKKQSEY
jgi:hypothetical protein